MNAQGWLSHLVFVLVQTAVVLLHHVVARSWALLPFHGLGIFGSYQLFRMCILHAAKMKFWRVVNVAFRLVSTVISYSQHLRTMHNNGEVEGFNRGMRHRMIGTNALLVVQKRHDPWTSLKSSTYAWQFSRFAKKAQEFFCTMKSLQFQCACTLNWRWMVFNTFCRYSTTWLTFELQQQGWGRKIYIFCVAPHRTWLLALVRLAHKATNSFLWFGVHQMPNMSISTRQFFSLFQHPAASRWYGWHSTYTTRNVDATEQTIFRSHVNDGEFLQPQGAVTAGLSLTSDPRCCDYPDFKVTTRQCGSISSSLFGQMREAAQSSAPSVCVSEPWFLDSECTWSTPRLETPRG